KVRVSVMKVSDLTLQAFSSASVSTRVTTEFDRIGMILFLQQRVEFLAGVAAGADRDTLGAHRAARGAQVVHAVLGLPALNRAGGVDLHAERAGLPDQPEREFERVDADAFGLEHRAGLLAFVVIVAAYFFGTQHPRRIAELFAHELRLLTRVLELLEPMREIEMSAVEGVAIDLAG